MDQWITLFLEPQMALASCRIFIVRVVCVILPQVITRMISYKLSGQQSSILERKILANHLCPIKFGLHQFLDLIKGLLLLLRKQSSK